MTITLNRSFFLFVSVMLLILVGIGFAYSELRDKMLEHKASSIALEMVLQHPSLRETIGAPVTIGAWVEGEGFLRTEDNVGIEVPLKGPLGEVVMVMKAKKEDQEWTFKTLRIESPDGSRILDLVDEIALNQSKDTRGDLLVLLGNGRALAGRGDYQGAVEIYQDVLSKDPRSAEAMRLWGIAAFRMEDLDLAETTLLKSLTTMVSNESDGEYAADTGSYPDWFLIVENWAVDGDIDSLDRWIEAVETLGLIYLFTERSTPCIETFTRIIQAGERSTSARIPKAWYHRAQCYLLQDMVDHAKIGARTACDKDPSLTDACKMAGLPPSR